MTRPHPTLAATPYLAALTLASALLLGGCGGGSAPSSVRGDCATGTASFCLQSCNLGCTLAGCVINEIAQNQPLIFNFSQDVDPSSINAGSISLKTATGEEPVGQLIVNRNSVQFAPEIRLVGSSTFFGFRPNETYILTLAGGEKPSPVRSTSGDTLPKSITCQLAVTKGVVDLDGQPPRATLIVPTTPSNVAFDTQIVLEFTELIDASSFTIGGSSPILYRLRKTRVGQGGARECNPNSPTVALGGSPRVVNDIVRQRTTVTYRPPFDLPGDACIEVEVSNRVRDLSGTPAIPAVFQFITQPASTTVQSLAEDFSTADKFEREVSSGSWGDRKATPGQLGGDGLHGEFLASLGRQISPNVYEWSTDDFTIPRTRTLSGSDERVTDGVFRFTTFKLDRDSEVIFKGTRPPRILVRGLVDVQGKITIRGGSQPQFSGTSPVGQVGIEGGVFGGRGGNGGDAGDGVANQTRFNGFAGENVRLPAGHAYAGRAADTGGKGSIQHPASGRNSDVTYNAFSGSFSAMVSAGGGGGGFRGAGAQGRAVNTTGSIPADLGAPAAGGLAFDPFPIPGGVRSIDHFLIGGSGGGGAGTQPFFSTRGTPASWGSGGAGAGGGGAIAFRVGYDLRMGSSALIDADGGSGFQTASAGSRMACPGGGGSGGSILLQFDGAVAPTMLGILSVRGGAGGFIRQPISFTLDVSAGDGAPGYVRLEMPGANPPPVAHLGTVRPAAGPENVGVLTDTDSVVGMQSKWYRLNRLLAPDFLRYEIRARLNGSTSVTLYSDDPALPGSAGQAVEGKPIRFLVQGAVEFDNGGQPVPSTIQPWRRFVGPFGTGGELALSDDSAVGFRFTLLFDRALASKIEVESVTFFYRG
ncbi:MAG: hypothetical protein IT458_03710 [Planctomycetes bacterium]|nr:hypothetical protein [Planctomycetota bacterium]